MTHKWIVNIPSPECTTTVKKIDEQLARFNKDSYAVSAAHTMNRQSIEDRGHIIRRPGFKYMFWFNELVDATIFSLMFDGKLIDALHEEKINDLIDEFDGRFRSANSVEIDRIWLSKEKWQEIRNVLLKSLA